MLPGTHAGAESDAKYSILILNSYHQGFKWTDDLTTAVVTNMEASLKKVDVHIEYMDAKRIYNEQLITSLYQLLSLKYKDRKPDVIITSDDDALTFIKRYHQELFAGIPVVFCGVNNVQAALNVPKNSFTGIIELLDISDNIQLAIKLFPRTSSIVIVSDGTPTGLGTRHMVSESESDYPSLQFIYLKGEELTTEEMLTYLRGVQPGSVVLAPAWYKDRDGKIFDNTEIYPLIAEASPVPVIATSSANLGLGLLGGKVNSGVTQGRYAAEQALRILSGQTSPSDLPVELASRNQYMFDSRQLSRFGISEEDLPKGSIVLHRPFSFYQTYRVLVWGIIAVFCLFTVMIIALLVNIHRLRDTRSSLVRSEENLRITLDSIGDAVITTDINGQITRMNPVAETLTGWTFAEAAKKPLDEVLRLFRSHSRDRYPNPADLVLAAGSTLPLEKDILLVAKNGDEYRISDSGAPIRNKDGEIIGIVLVFRDITADYLRETQLNQSRKLEAIGQLAGGVAHDFNNMLGGILGSAEMLAMSIGHENPLHKYIGTIIKACDNAAGLTQKLLAFSRKGAMVVASMDIHAAIVNVQGLLEHSLDKSITINHAFKATQSIITGDSALIENCLINLCVNAAHSMPEGGTITISTNNLELDEDFCQASPFAITPGRYIEIGIQDTGIGIPPEMLDRIFEPFFTTKAVGKGTGLGLSAVYGTIKEHRGCLSLYSEVGVGTVFYLYLPVSGTVPHQLARQENPLEQGSGCILIIDDEQVLRTTTAAILEQLGYRVLLAKDGMEGVEMYKMYSEQVDLTLLDMIMPRMGGVTCAKAIRAINPDARILICSGFIKEESRSELHKLGISAFVKKPYRREELARAVVRAMGT